MLLENVSISHLMRIGYAVSIESSSFGTAQIDGIFAEVVKSVARSCSSPNQDRKELSEHGTKSDRTFESNLRCLVYKA